MKNIKLVWLAFFGLILFSPAATAAQSKDYVALYRLYNSQSGDHLYTTDCAEKDKVVRNDGYVYEGITGYVARRSMRRTTPLYRILLNNGAHFYTIDEREMNNLMRDGGNRSEGVVGYVSSSSQRNTAPLYRMLESNGRHLYTTDERERNTLQNSGSRLESVSGYLWTSGSDDCGSGGYPGGGSGDYPVIYSNLDYTGASKVLDGDWNVTDDWDGSPNSIRSIRVPSGWYVTFYRRKNFRGESGIINADGVFADNNPFLNRIRSFKVSRGNPPR